jgi:hypothetical protein
MSEIILQVVIFGVGGVLFVGFVGFWGLYGGLAIWNEFVEPVLARRRKHKEDMESWNEYD